MWWIDGMVVRTHGKQAGRRRRITLAPGQTGNQSLTSAAAAIGGRLPRTLTSSIDRWIWSGESGLACEIDDRSIGESRRKWLGFWDLPILVRGYSTYGLFLPCWASVCAQILEIGLKRAVSIELLLFSLKFKKLPLFVSIAKNYHILFGRSQIALITNWTWIDTISDRWDPLIRANLLMWIWTHMSGQ